jgi:hypothetical protein
VLAICNHDAIIDYVRSQPQQPGQRPGP